MAGSVNKVILIGNLGRDPEVRFTQSGTKIVNFSLATSERWKDKQTGEQKEKTEWHRVVIFNEHLADIAEKYLQKGSKVYVEGQLQTRKWTGNDGNERYTTEVALQRFRGELTMLDSRGGGGGSEQAAAAGAGEPPAWDSPDNGGGGGSEQAVAGAAAGAGGGGGGAGAELDDEIPF